ncbi:motile sperm domain-containing protein 2-like, partial [Oppia nitens]|uniref:motile sperm domain-containing protein 2-like n=1 Tax=Oppia nitens TaxID=1686743 RepID=UPI0023DB70C0
MVDEITIEKLRQKFLTELKTNGHNLYHESDVRRVTANDWEIKRFLIEYKSEDKAYQWMTTAFCWRKSFGVYDRSDQYFPKEFYELTEKEITGRDRDGRLIQWECYRNDRSVDGFADLQKQFMAHIVHQLDSRVGEDGCTIVSDIKNAGLINVSYELMRFRMQLMQYYPLLARRIIVLDLPFVLNAFTRLIMSLVSTSIQNRVAFIGRDELPEFVDEDVIPVRFGGRRHELGFPDGLRPLSNLKLLPLNAKQIDK